MAGQDWPIDISGAAGQVTFDPNPLTAQVSDIVYWSNRTDDTHQISIGGQQTDPIAPWSSSSPGYVVVLPAGTVTGTIPYTCTLHSGESGTINVV